VPLAAQSRAGSSAVIPGRRRNDEGDRPSDLVEFGGVVKWTFFRRGVTRVCVVREAGRRAVVNRVAAFFAVEHQVF